MFCKYCGNQIDDDALFCAKCGKRTDVQESVLSEKPILTSTDVQVETENQEYAPTKPLNSGFNFQSWITETGLESYEDALRSQDCDTEEVLVSLSEEDLERIGINIGGRRKIMNAIKRLDASQETPQANEQQPAVQQPVQNDGQPQNHFHQTDANFQLQASYQSQTQMCSQLFKCNVFRVRWSKGSYDIANYEIFDGNVIIGFIREQKLDKKTAGGIALGALLGFNAAAHSNQILPYEMHILDSNGNLLTSISRGASMIRQKISIKNANGIEIAKVDSKGSKFRTMNLTISNSMDIPLAIIHGKPSEMKIIESSGNEIGNITDRVDINITGFFPDENVRIAVISTALCMDKILTAAGLYV